MAIFFGTSTIVRDGLVLYLDAANPKSYPGTGNIWKDLSGNGFNFTLDGSGITWDSNGYFNLANGGATYNGVITNNTLCTLVFWIRTTDNQALFWQGQSGSHYLGAYRVGRKEYHANFGTPVFYMDTVDTPNIYDYIRDNNWHMLEFKNVNMSSIITNNFNQYGNYTFGNGSIASIYMYNKSLSSEESKQNYNIMKKRFLI
jgi:hypothetical protein